MDISKDLSWNTHINWIAANANNTLGFLKRNIKTQHTGIRTAAFSTLVRPQVEYASPVWSPYTQIYMYVHKLEMVQRRAICWVSNNYSSYASVTTQMQNNLGWHTLEDRRADAPLILFNKIVYGLVAVPLPAFHNLTDWPGTCIHCTSSKYQLQPATISIHSFPWWLFNGTNFIIIFLSSQTLGQGLGHSTLHALNHKTFYLFLISSVT